MGKHQDLAHLHPFGCMAYAKIPEEYTLIGYFGHGTYKLWDWASGTAIKSRDIIFEEG